MHIVAQYKLQCDMSFTIIFLRFGNLNYTTIIIGKLQELD